MEKELTITRAFSFARSLNPTAELSEAAAEISGDDDDFEFAFSSVKTDPSVPTVMTTADEIFSDGWILPVYPIFNSELVASNLRIGLASLSPSKSSELDDVVGIRGEMEDYCVWTPRSVPQSQERWRKSSSTGSAVLHSRRCRIRDLIVGRSRSDGKEKLVVFPVEEIEMEKRDVFSPNPTHRSVAVEVENKGKSGKERSEAVKKMDIVTAHRIYGKGVASGGKATTGGAQRSFLPYQQELLGGFFRYKKSHV